MWASHLRLRLLLRVELPGHLVLLGLPLRLALGLGLGLGLAGLGLVRERLEAELLRLLLVNRLHQHTLVLELVTLSAHVEAVVEVLVDLLRLAVLAEKTAEHAHAAHPEHLHREAGARGTLTLTVAGVAAFPLRVEVAHDARARVDNLRLLDHEAILDELADVLPGVGHRDLIGLVRVKPDLAAAALKDRR